jgi:hypothetical protein
LFFLNLDQVAQPVDRVNDKIADLELYEKLLILPQLGWLNLLARSSQG